MHQKKQLSLFERVIFEAPGDPPPDMPAGNTVADVPPDIPEDIQDNPPDISGGDDTSGGSMEGEDPPDIGMGDDQGEDSGDFGDTSANDGEEQPELSEKISTVMNQNLYQRFLSLLNNIGSQLSAIKNNSDVLYTLSSESLDIIESLKKLDENVRLYLNNSFLRENYSKNLLFFNKCLNLLKLLNDIFEKNVKKGIRDMD